MLTSTASVTTPEIAANMTQTTNYYTESQSRSVATDHPEDNSNCGQLWVTIAGEISMNVFVTTHNIRTPL